MEYDAFFQVGLSGLFELFVGKFSGRSWKYVCNILNANNMCKDINGRNQLDAHQLSYKGDRGGQ